MFGSFCQVIFYDSDWNPTVDQQVLNSKRQACLGRFLLGQSDLKFWPGCGVELFCDYIMNFSQGAIEITLG